MSGYTPQELFDNYHPIGTCIMNSDYVAILARQTMPDDGSEAFYENFGYEVKVVVYDLAKKHGRRWGVREFTAGLKNPLIVNTELNEYLFTDKTCQVYYAGVGENKSFEKKVHPLVPAYDIANIDGVIFAASFPRALYVRKGPSEWEWVLDAYNWPGYKKIRGGFTLIDGFSLNDIYAAGADRDIWRFNYNTNEWRPIDIGCLGRFYCSAICCAEDGKVYIGGSNGMIARGRDDYWEVKKLNIKEKIKKIVSYQGKIFLGTEGFTLVLNDDLTVTEYDFDGEVTFTGGHLMYAAHGMMMVANYFGQVALHDGKRWQNLYGCETFNPIEQQAADEDYNNTMNKLGDALERLNDALDDADKG